MEDVEDEGMVFNAFHAKTAKKNAKSFELGMTSFTQLFGKEPFYR
jgi:hypothetical protein